MTVVTHTNCRHVVDPGMHGCRADKVTQIQLPNTFSRRKCTNFCNFWPVDGLRIT